MPVGRLKMGLYEAEEKDICISVQLGRVEYVMFEKVTTPSVKAGRRTLYEYCKTLQIAVYIPFTRRFQIQFPSADQ